MEQQHQQNHKTNLIAGVRVGTASIIQTQNNICGYYSTFPIHPKTLNQDLEKLQSASPLGPMETKFCFLMEQQHRQNHKTNLIAGVRVGTASIIQTQNNISGHYSTFRIHTKTLNQTQIEKLQSQQVL